MRIETLLEETFQPKLQEIADAVCRLEAANDDPENTPAGRELCRRADEAHAAALAAHEDALKAFNQAKDAADTAASILGVWEDIKGVISSTGRAIVIIAAIVGIVVGLHTLGWAI